MQDTEQGLKTLLQTETDIDSDARCIRGEWDNAIHNTATQLTTDTVRANERLRMWTGSVVCCLPLDAFPSLEGSLVKNNTTEQSSHI